MEIPPGADFGAIMRAMAEAAIAALPKRRRAAPARLTGMAHALANPALLARGEETAVARYADAAAWWRQAIPDESSLPMPPEVLVRVIGALTEGLTLQRLMTPDLIPDAVIHAAFAALVCGPAPPES
ncbi:MAG: transcriptional regulator, TetR family [Caulobacter sp.]|nr:transcriptional regulator, TetR family [Caulobacter sp.]